MYTTAYINIWNQRVGAIAWDANSGWASFEYEPSFLANQWDLAPLKMPISGAEKHVFSFPELRNAATFKGLPGLLADILPDKYGSSLINAWLASNGRPSDSMNPVELLCFIGARGMGALEFEPVVPKANNGATKIELSSLIQIANLIRIIILVNPKETQSRPSSPLLAAWFLGGNKKRKAHTPISNPHPQLFTLY